MQKHDLGFFKAACTGLAPIRASHIFDLLQALPYFSYMFQEHGKVLQRYLPTVAPALPSGGIGTVRRSTYARTAFGVHAYDVRCTCVQHSVYVAVVTENIEETAVKTMT